MDIVDRDLEKAERGASPERFPAIPADGEGKPERRQSAVSASSSSSSSSTSVIREEMGMPTTQINTRTDLERHPTALSRIETHKTQHSGTVGRSMTSRSSKKPLPPFGDGKDYPPQLPAKEDYVVEFDGHDDPLHPQNWPVKKK